MRTPPEALTALLDALEADLLAAPAEEVARDVAVQEVRALLRDAEAADPPVLPFGVAGWGVSKRP